ncbi:glycerate kinase [Mordavella massiliensis]|uniref:Glycerate kinase n=1 Tax=Mordavella massiliensis TaxID=1871024 RepID=A0A938XD18_9CLOT|nr:glycerate kinase [Mordavella massiliensis]MBM6949278.1 glycerate kinase [Mordavella massiliensis]
MKVVAAIDSFKGSLSSMEAGHAAKEGVLLARPEADMIVKPLADGGEGTTDALIEGMNGQKVEMTATGPLGKPVDCYYGYLPDSRTAIIEMAAAAGITLVTEAEKDPLAATTYGVGEMILNAMEKGCRNFIIGIGGSATNDGGIGMLRALGFTFADQSGADPGEGAQALAKIASVKTDGKHPLLTDCHFRIACDVNNPLCGENGATYIYGPQKGVTEDMKQALDEGMANYAAAVSRDLGCDYREYPGAGAAGGLGFAFLSFLGAELSPGIDLILDAVGLEAELKDADIVITGEGRLDHQTAMGKAPVGVAKLAKKYGAKVIAIAGSVTREATACNDAGIDAFFPVVRGVTTLEEAMKPEVAKENIRQTINQVFRLL